jgi:succinate dehydrogenase / fumarate reductase cytochrome b subunit
MVARPLSPHLGIYRFMYTMATSFAHRATGMALAAGLIVLAWWLTALASGETAYLGALRWLATWPVKVVLFGLLAAFLYHFANGVRHLLWDAGYGLEKQQARRSAWLMVTAVVIAVTAFGYLLFCPEWQQP